MARTGKIARFPIAVREELNTRMRDGQTGLEILPWLNALSEVQTVLGKVRVWCVRYETYEMDSAAFDDTTFTLHDANEPEPRLIARLVAS